MVFIVSATDLQNGHSLNDWGKEGKTSKNKSLEARHSKHNENAGYLINKRFRSLIFLILAV